MALWALYFGEDLGVVLASGQGAAFKLQGLQELQSLGFKASMIHLLPQGLLARLHATASFI